MKIVLSHIKGKLLQYAWLVVVAICHILRQYADNVNLVYLYTYIANLIGSLLGLKVDTTAKAYST